MSELAERSSLDQCVGTTQEVKPGAASQAGDTDGHSAERGCYRHTADPADLCPCRVKAGPHPASESRFHQRGLAGSFSPSGGPSQTTSSERASMASPHEPPALRFHVTPSGSFPGLPPPGITPGGCVYLVSASAASLEAPREQGPAHPAHHPGSKPTSPLAGCAMSARRINEGVVDSQGSGCNYAPFPPTEESIFEHRGARVILFITKSVCPGHTTDRLNHNIWGWGPEVSI